MNLLVLLNYNIWFSKTIKGSDCYLRLRLKNNTVLFNEFCTDLQLLDFRFKFLE